MSGTARQEEATSTEEVSRAAALGTRFADVRRATVAIAAPLSAEDCLVQSMPDASPIKWHLAHTTWFFETFVLARASTDYLPFHPDFAFLFNSYYEAVGPRHERPQRGLLTRPSLDEVRAYREAIDQRVADAIEGAAADVLDVIELGLHHEQQHQELMLTDLLHALAMNPLRPSYKPIASIPVPPERARPPALAWVRFPEGLRAIGHEPARGFAFDNELPRHKTYVAAYELASRAATKGELLAFVEAGGYDDPDAWLSDGFAARTREGWTAPLYWVKKNGRWFEMTLGGLVALASEEPATNLSFYEAWAFARWSGARLPTEAEWEVAADTPAARAAIADGNFVESGALRPLRAHAEPRADADGRELLQMFGDVWEWTSTSYAPYPGFAPLAGALGEYNGKFMCNQMVLRGGSCLTPRSHVRPTYRNFFHPDARWQMSGLRLARDSAVKRP
jgi:ergothioneine biosynthesis protein EgtB